MSSSFKTPSSASGELFEQIIHPASLHAAWRKVRSNRGAAGGDGVTVEQFEQERDVNLARLALELKAGLYRPGPLRNVDIPKRGGPGMRTLDIPCIVDRVAQTAVATVLGELIEPHLEESSYAYRPGRSAAQAVARVASLRRQGFTWVVEGDIRAFFDEIPHKPLLDVFSKYAPDADLIDLIELWLESFADDGVGLAQGSPISPVLANLYLDAVDEAIESKGVRLVRFADDFVLLTRSEAQAHGALERMSALLAQYCLRLHPDKTRIVPFEQAFRFLGALFVRSIVIEDSKEEPPHSTTAPKLARRLGTAPSDEELEAAGPATTLTSNLIRRQQVAASETVEPIENDENNFEEASPHAARVLYMLEAERTLGVSGACFAVLDEGREIALLPGKRLGRIEVGPGAAITDAALRLALAWRTPIYFLDGYGRTDGMLLPGLAPKPELHLSQAALCLDPERRLTVACSLVAGRLHNQRTLLKRLNQRRKLRIVAEACDRIEHVCRKVPSAETLSELMGMEGQGTADYWPALSACLLHGWKLKTRERHGDDGPFGPVNAVLNWTASLLTRDLSAIVHRVGLHPGISTLHTTGGDREACVFDLIEEFRAPLAEGLTVYLFNNRILQAEDFTELEDGRCRVASGAGSKLIRTYEKWLARIVKSPRQGTRISWRALMEEQAYAFVRTAQEGSEYQPYAMDY